MTLRTPLISIAVSFTLATIFACSGGGGGGGAGGNGSSAPPGLYCSANIGGTALCYGYSNLTAAQQSAVSQACTSSLQGTIQSSCPSGQVGCCTTTEGFTTTECYYAGTASELSAACGSANGTWSATGSTGSSSGGAGSSGSGSSNGGGSSGTNGSSSGSGTGSGSSNGGGACSGSEVACPSGCAALSSDVKNCGSCEFACPAGPAGTAAVCSAGKCGTECNASGTTLCGTGSDQACVTLESDVNNCGSCGHWCEDPSGGGAATCSGGTCGGACSGATTDCSGSCADTTSDVNNCGGCGVSCAEKAAAAGVKGGTLSCVQGACVDTVTAARVVINCSTADCGQSCDQLCMAQTGVSCDPNVAADDCPSEPGTCGFYETAGELCNAAVACSDPASDTTACMYYTLTAVDCNCSGVVKL